MPPENLYAFKAALPTTKGEAAAAVKKVADKAAEKLGAAKKQHKKTVDAARALAKKLKAEEKKRKAAEKRAKAAKKEAKECLSEAEVARKAAKAAATPSKKAGKKKAKKKAKKKTAKKTVRKTAKKTVRKTAKKTVRKAAKKTAKKTAKKAPSRTDLINTDVMPTVGRPPAKPRKPKKPAGPKPIPTLKDESPIKLSSGPSQVGTGRRAKLISTKKTWICEGNTVTGCGGGKKKGQGSKMIGMLGGTLAKPVIYRTRRGILKI